MDQNQPGASRRHFLTTTAAAATAAAIVPRHVLGGTGFVPPSDKVNVAVIGVGGQGTPQRARAAPGEGLPESTSTARSP